MNIDKQISQIKSSLTGCNEEWIMERRAVALPIEELGLDVSPHMLICVSIDVGIVSTEILPPDAPDSEALSWALGCMLSPMEGKPRRPKSILLSGGGLEALRPALAQTGVQVRINSESHPILDEAVSMMEQGISEGGVPPYLIEPDMDPETAADFFQAAAEFYKLKPWRYFEFEIPMKVVLKLKRPEIYWAVVMGVEEQQFGLSLFCSAADMVDIFETSSLAEAGAIVQKTNSCGFTFDNVDEIGRLAESEYQTNGWVLAAKSAYPSAIVFDPSDPEGPRMPNKKELEDLIAVTRAMTRFCKAYRKEIEEAGDEIELVEDTFTVPVLGRQIEVFIEFPAPEFLENDIE